MNIEIEEAIEILKRNLPQLGKYSFRLGPDGNALVRNRMIQLRDRIEADIRRLLRVRNKTLLAIGNEHLLRLASDAVRTFGLDAGDDQDLAVADAIRRDLQFKLQGNLYFVRARLFQLPDLPAFEYSSPETEERTRLTRDWIDNQISFPEVSVFERIAFDKPDDAFLVDLAYPTAERASA